MFLKNLAAAIVITGLWLASPATASAANNWKWDEAYASVKGGWNWIQDDDGYDFDTGYNVLGALGYKVNPNTRTELEAGWSSADLDAGGDIDTITLMANAYYDFDMNMMVTPYLGAGIGAAHQDLTGEDGSWEFAYQGMAGAAYDITKATAALVEYRYRGTTNIGSTGYDSHNLLVGLRFNY